MYIYRLEGAGLHVQVKKLHDTVCTYILIPKRPARGFSTTTHCIRTQRLTSPA